MQDEPTVESTRALPDGVPRPNVHSARLFDVLRCLVGRTRVLAHLPEDDTFPEAFTFDEHAEAHGENAFAVFAGDFNARGMHFELISVLSADCERRGWNAHAWHDVGEGGVTYHVHLSGRGVDGSARGQPTPALAWATAYLAAIDATEARGER